MRISRKLFALAALLVAAFAFVAPSASAQVEAINEDTLDHCGPVTVVEHEAEGDCEITAHNIDSPHLSGPGVLLAQGGVPLMLCSWEFEGYVAEDGTGLITHQSLTNPDPLNPTCVVRPCEEPDATHSPEFEPWPFQITETAGSEHLRLFFCMTTNPMAEATPCRLDLAVIRTGHHYLFDVEDEHCFGIPTAPEFIGRWESEMSNTEIVHSE